jgi:hypothetical protein
MNRIGRTVRLTGHIGKTGRKKKTTKTEPLLLASRKGGSSTASAMHTSTHW